MGTLCWDCSHACGGCEWSDDFMPVDGWKAVYKEDKDSYSVYECPKFLRDGFEGGLYRVKEYPDVLRRRRYKIKLAKMG